MNDPWTQPLPVLIGAPSCLSYLGLNSWSESLQTTIMAAARAAKLRDMLKANKASGGSSSGSDAVNKKLQRWVDGVLHCGLCQISIKNESLWDTHCSGKLHQTVRFVSLLHPLLFTLYY
jgi:hypothetical protein